MDNTCASRNLRLICIMALKLSLPAFAAKFTKSEPNVVLFSADMNMPHFTEIRTIIVKNRCIDNRCT